MISPPRRLAFEILRRIELGGEFSNDAVNSYAVSRLQPRDRNLTTEIVFGTLRWQLLLDHVLSTVVARPWSEVDADIRILLRMSLHQMWHMDRIPDHALVDDAVELAKRESVKQGAPGFINGVLRNLGRSEPWRGEEFVRGLPLWARASLPLWLWDRWKARFGEGRAMEYAISLNQPPRHCCRAAGTAEGTNLTAGVSVPSDIVPGAFFCDVPMQSRFQNAQDEASQLIPHLLGPVRGRRIWDACASPGGKSAILREGCGPSGLVISSDLSWRRINHLRNVLRGQPPVPLTLVTDASKTPPFLVRFDAVLADVPCSGLGTLRRHPEIKWRFREERLCSLQQKQISILGGVADAVRAGGLLLYSTCSTEPEENEQVVDAFLNSHGGFRLVPPTFPPGVEAWTDDRGFMRTFPSTRLWDSFFAAIMVRFS